MGDMENKTPWIIGAFVVGVIVILAVTPLGNSVVEFVTDTFSSMFSKASF